MTRTEDYLSAHEVACRGDPWQRVEDAAASQAAINPLVAADLGDLHGTWSKVGYPSRPNVLRTADVIGVDWCHWKLTVTAVFLTVAARFSLNAEAMSLHISRERPKLALKPSSVCRVKISTL